MSTERKFICQCISPRANSLETYATKKNKFTVQKYIITKMYVKMIMSLVFVSISSVVKYSLHLEDYFKINDSWEDLIVLHWFKSEYLNHDKNNKSMKFWNVYDRVSNGIPRTTNGIDGYLRL
ncbi:hypothetical protein DMUE_4496 [Dictyocoela muelleri]|nr:hypothetical protein DMUE_4496 [Dictyocoela muelleri]